MVELDAKSISLAELTRFIAEVSNQNIVVIDQELGSETFSIYAPKAVSVEDACELFYSAVRARGLTVEDHGSYVTISK